jgi:hypothetical protein
MITLLSSTELDEKLKIFLDIKKELIYNKHTGKWGWYDRNDPTNEVYPFLSALEAIEDAISPYVEEE